MFDHEAGDVARVSAPDLPALLSLAAQLMDTSVDALRDRSRRPAAAVARRRVVAWLLVHAGGSFEDVADAMHRDNSTVQQIVRLVSRDPDLLASAGLLGVRMGVLDRAPGGAGDAGLIRAAARAQRRRRQSAAARRARREMGE